VTLVIPEPLPQPAPARVNWSRWIVDCPICTSALALDPGTTLFECWDCGARAEVDWPDAELRAGIERLLMLRPDEQTRNWHPGESLHDLLAENLEHGALGLDGPAELVGGRLLQIDDERIVVDNLPATRALTAPGRRLEIGS